MFYYSEVQREDSGSPDRDSPAFKVLTRDEIIQGESVEKGKKGTRGLSTGVLGNLKVRKELPPEETEEEGGVRLEQTHEGTVP